MNSARDGGSARPSTGTGLGIGYSTRGSSAEQSTAAGGAGASMLMSYNSNNMGTTARQVDNSGVVSYGPADYLDAIQTRRMNNTFKQDITASNTAG